MGMFSTIGSMFGPIGTLVGGAVDGYQANKNNKKAQGVKHKYANEIAAAQGPVDVAGINGGVKFNEDGSPTMYLNPEMQDYYDGQMSYAQSQRDLISGLGTGEEAATRFYEQQRSMFGQKALNDRLRAENRLRQKNGSTTESAQMMGQFDYQQMMADQKMQVDAWDGSQNQIDSEIDRMNGAAKNATTLGQSIDNHTVTGMNLGIQNGRDATAVANIKMNADTTKIAQNVAFWDGLSNTVSDQSGWSGMLSGGSSPWGGDTTYVPGGSYTGQGDLAVWGA